MTLWDATSGLCTEAGQELASPGCSICNSATFLPLHSLCSPCLLLTWLLSLGSKVSPFQCLHSQGSKAPEVPPCSTCSCVCYMWAWTRLGAQQVLQGMNLTQGWGSSNTSLCPTKLNPQHLPGCQEERESWYPMITPNQPPPREFRAVTKQRGEDGGQNKSSPGLAMEFGGKITLFYPLACEKHWRGTTCAQSQPGPGAQPCSHVGREQEVVPTLTHRMDTHKKNGNCECGKGFPETAEKPRPR